MKTVLINEKVNKLLSLMEKTGDPLSADFRVLKSTLENCLNYYAIDDVKQAFEYISLLCKQSLDVKTNLQLLLDDRSKSVPSPAPASLAKEAPASEAPVKEAPAPVELPVEEGKVPDVKADNEETRKQLLEMAEKCYLVKKLKERKTLTEKQKAFITATESVELDEATRAKVLELIKTIGKK